MASYSLVKSAPKVDVKSSPACALIVSVGGFGGGCWPEVTEMAACALVSVYFWPGEISMLLTPTAFRPEMSSPSGLALMMTELVFERFPAGGVAPFNGLPTVAIDACKAVNV